MDHASWIRIVINGYSTTHRKISKGLPKALVRRRGKQPFLMRLLFVTTAMMEGCEIG